MRIIIAIDLLGGKCVRLTRGDFRTKKIYDEDPLNVAKTMEDHGLKYLHLVDLDGTKNRKPENLRILEKIASKTNLKIDFGGGIRSYDDILTILSAGAKQVTAGSKAVREPHVFLEWLTKLGQQKLILGADFIDRKIAVEGWTEKSDRDIVQFISEYKSKGVKYVICTDINKDGTLKGPSTKMYREILDSVNINLIASGGVSSVMDIEKIRETGCEGVIIGKAFYEGMITMKDIETLC
jgi:phosphoribosylformimino-5-aminoimidazole carboxamide ribotide isomerase